MIIYRNNDTWTFVGRSEWTLTMVVRDDELDVWQGKLSDVIGEHDLGRDVCKYDLGAWEALYGPDMCQEMTVHVNAWLKTKCNWKPTTIGLFWNDVWDAELLRCYALGVHKYTNKPEVKEWLNGFEGFDFPWLNEMILLILDKTGGIE